MLTPCPPTFVPDLIPAAADDWQFATRNSQKLREAMDDKDDEGRQYGVLLLRPGNIHFDDSININRPIILRGSGQGDVYAIPVSATKLLFRPVAMNDNSKTGDGIVISGAAGYTCIEDLSLQCTGGVRPTGLKGSGIRIQSSFVNIARVTVARFGEHGITMFSDGDHMCDFVSLSFVWSRDNGNVGFVSDHGPAGPNSNITTFLGCRAQENHGYGFFDGSANNLYLHCSAIGNEAGAFRFHAMGGAAISPYCENANDSMFFGQNASGWTVILGPWGPMHMTNDGDTAPVVIEPFAVTGDPGHIPPIPGRRWSGKFVRYPFPEDRPYVPPTEQ